MWTTVTRVKSAANLFLNHTKEVERLRGICVYLCGHESGLTDFWFEENAVVCSLPWGKEIGCWKAFVFIEQDETIKKCIGIDWLELSVCWRRGSHPTSASERWRFKATREWTSQVGSGCLTYTTRHFIVLLYTVKNIFLSCK